MRSQNSQFHNFGRVPLRMMILDVLKRTPHILLEPVHRWTCIIHGAAPPSILVRVQAVELSLKVIHTLAHPLRNRSIDRVHHHPVELRLYETASVAPTQKALGVLTKSPIASRTVTVPNGAYCSRFVHSSRGPRTGLCKISPVGSLKFDAPPGKWWVGSGKAGRGTVRFAAQNMTRSRPCGVPYCAA